MLLLSFLACPPTPEDTAIPTSETLDWQSCDGDFECATLPVGDTSVAVVRHLGTSPNARTLLLATGGPGASSINLLEYLIKTTGALDPDFWLKNTWIAMDNRGVGRSDQVICGDSAWFEDIRGRDPIPANDNDALALQASRDAFQAGCLADRSEAELAELSSSVYADDIDQFRIALGLDQIDYIGFSGGTLVGALYASHYPEHVGHFVLDGVMAPPTTRDAFLQSQADGMELALQRFFARCAANLDCPIYEDPAGVYDRLLAAATVAPLPAPSDALGRSASPNTLRWAMTSMLYSPDDVTIGSVLAMADAGDAALVLAAADGGWGLDIESGDYDTLLQGYWAIGCLDQPWPADWTDSDVWAFGAHLNTENPRVGLTMLSGELNCQGWPVPSPTLDLGAPAAAPLLLVNGNYDPATPMSGAQAMQTILNNDSVLLSFEGDGHVAFFSDTTGCSYLAEREYLLTGATTSTACP